MTTEVTEKLETELQEKNIFVFNKLEKRPKDNLDYLFKDYHKNLNKFSVLEVERERSLENLRKLTIQLQTRRLHLKSKDFCKYFTL